MKLVTLNDFSDSNTYNFQDKTHWGAIYIIYDLARKHKLSGLMPLSPLIGVFKHTDIDTHPQFSLPSVTPVCSNITK